jgi:hypothetical protein
MHFCNPKCSPFNLLDLVNTKVCKECGRETLQLSDPSLGARHSGDALFITHYSRVNRFMRLLESVVLPHGTTKDTQMLQWLDRNKEDISTPETLLRCMQKSGLADKRYSSLHLFHRIHMSDYHAPRMPSKYLQDKKRFQRAFLDIEFAHRRCPHTQFFNYAWLLRHMLQSEPAYAEFLVYIKCIKCPKRRSRYQEMLDSLNIGCTPQEFLACDQNCDASDSEREDDP